VGNRDTRSPDDAFRSSLKGIVDRLRRVEALSGSGVQAGSCAWWPGVESSVPAGYLPIPSAPVSRSTYAGLFAIIGTQYGPGDGHSTFDLPAESDLPARGGALGLWIIRA
jgi:hypothetical protein